MQFLLKAEARVEQEKAAQASRTYINGVGVVITPFLVLTVNRTHLLQETLAQASRVKINVFGLAMLVRAQTTFFSLSWGDCFCERRASDDCEISRVFLSWVAAGKYICTARSKQRICS